MLCVVSLFNCCDSIPCSNSTQMYVTNFENQDKHTTLSAYTNTHKHFCNHFVVCLKYCGSVSCSNGTQMYIECLKTSLMIIYFYLKRTKNTITTKQTNRVFLTDFYVFIEWWNQYHTGTFVDRLQIVKKHRFYIWLIWLKWHVEFRQRTNKKTILLKAVSQSEWNNNKTFFLCLKHHVLHAH